MCLRVVPSELAKKGSQSWHSSIPHCLMSSSMLEKEITALCAALRKRVLSATMVWRKCVSLLLAIQDVTEKKWSHRQFSVLSSLWTHKSAIAGPKNLWSLLCCQEIKPTRAKLPSPSTLQRVELFWVSMIHGNAYQQHIWAYTGDPTIGFTILFNHSSFLLLGLQHLSALKSDMILSRVQTSQCSNWKKKSSWICFMIMQIIPTWVCIYLWSIRHMRYENRGQLQLPH